MLLVRNHPYANQHWAVRSLYGGARDIETLRIGARELEFPYATGTRIPMDFDTPNRFIDRGLDFNTIVIAERNLKGQELDFDEVLDCGRALVTRAAAVEMLDMYPANPFQRLGAGAVQLGLFRPYTGNQIS